MRRAGEDGLSLLEVLIAVVIAGIALTIVFQAAAETMRSTGIATRYQHGMLDHDRLRLNPPPCRSWSNSMFDRVIV